MTLSMPTPESIQGEWHCLIHWHVTLNYFLFGSRVAWSKPINDFTVNLQWRPVVLYKKLYIFLKFHNIFYKKDHYSFLYSFSKFTELWGCVTVLPCIVQSVNQYLFGNQRTSTVQRPKCMRWFQWSKQITPGMAVQVYSNTGLGGYKATRYDFLLSG